MKNKRLEKIVTLIDNNKSVIDCGCDHALLSIELVNKKNCKVIASDINENALNSAIKNVKKSNLEDKIKIIKQDGIEEIGNSSICIIAGMGTSTILNILDNPNREKFEKIIIQSNNNLTELRKSLNNLDLIIYDEHTVFDKGKWYVIIEVINGNKKYNYKDALLGPSLKNKNSSKEYYLYEYNKLKQIYIKIPYTKLRTKLSISRDISIYDKKIKIISTYC